MLIVPSSDRRIMTFGELMALCLFILLPCLLLVATG
jgi:hypothetical protein